MKKLSVLCVIFLTTMTINAQKKQDKMMKVTYKSIPFSQYKINPNDDSPEEEKNITTALSHGYKYYYNLTLDLKENKSIYVYDTLIIDKPKGGEDYWLEPEDKLHYCIRKNATEYFKKEEIFQRVFHTTGTISDIKWDITNEKKEILGFECIKATSQREDFLITVWFTKEIPVNSGPSNHFGLPGIVLWSEDFFRTISAEKIEYIDDPLFSENYKKCIDEFESKGGANETKEMIFLIKKAQLVGDMRNQM